MIRLFLLDIDGCVTEPFVTPSWEALTGIRELQIKSFEREEIPSLTLCTGRPYPYTEAVAQYLDIRHPVIFESGGGLYDPEKYNLEMSPYFDERALREKQDISRFVENEVLPRYSTAFLEFSKYTDVGIVGSDEKHIKQMYEQVKSWVEARYPDVEVHSTPVSVNVIRKQCNKAEGIRHIARYSGIPMEQMAYIGDSSGDLKAIREAAISFAPANAIPDVKSEVDYIMKSETTHAVLEAYQQLVEINRKALEEERP